MEMLLDWLTMLTRWLHVMAGIAWVGTSFYFNWFDSLVRPTEQKRQKENLRGILHEIHGGSFYYHEQYWPDTHPPNMQRHSWPAKTTFLTGLMLLALIYWVGASTYLVDPQVANIAPWQAIAISISSIVLCWFGYDTLCKRTEDNRIVLAGMAVATVFAAWGFHHVFGARAAYIHVGAMLGSMMGLNVWLQIVPHHIAMTGQLNRGEKLDTHHGYLSKRRSLHNNYFTLPVVFTMISNHFALAYNHPYSWVILSLIMAGGLGIRHSFNVFYKEGRKAWELNFLIIVAFVLAIGISLIQATPKIDPNMVVDDAMGMRIVYARCAGCHSLHPTQPGFTAPAQGMALDTPEQVKAKKDLVLKRVVMVKDMPLANLTKMTDEERAMLKAWLDKPAP